MLVSERGLAFVAKREALSLSAYEDGAFAIGFGRHLPGLTADSKSTVAECCAELVRYADAIAEHDIDRVFNGVKLKQHQYDAIFSLTWNIGGTSLRKQVMLIASIERWLDDPTTVNRGWLAEHWFHVKFSSLNGPHNPERKMDEYRLFTQGDYGKLDTIMFWDVDAVPKIDPPTDTKYPMPRFRQ